MVLMLVHFFLLRSIPWFINDDGNIDGLFYILMIATQICQQVSVYTANFFSVLLPLSVIQELHPILAF